MGVDFMHAIRVDGICIFKIIAREYSLSQLATTDTRQSYPLCLGTGRRIPPKILTVYVTMMIVFNCVSLSYHVPFVK